MQSHAGRGRQARAGQAKISELGRIEKAKTTAQELREHAGRNKLATDKQKMQVKIHEVMGRTW
jgi:hypothetical protein